MPRIELQEVSAIVESLEISKPTNAFDLIKIVERESRREFGAKSVEFFSRPRFIQSMLNIGAKYAVDGKILEYSIRTLTMIALRCSVDLQKSQNISDIHDPRTQSMYEFLFRYKDSANKTIKKLVAYSIPYFPQFEEYEAKWEYILLIPKIAPQKDSMNEFREIIEKKITEVPDNLKGVIVEMFQNFIKKHELHFHTQQQYISVIEQLQ